MGILMRFWYVFVIALVLSLMAAFGMIMVRKDLWMPTAAANASARELPQVASSSFREWNFASGEVEDLRIKMEAEWEKIRQRETELDLLAQQIRNERSELDATKRALEALRESINREFITIQDDEARNLQNLAAIYSEMKAPAAVAIFAEMEVETVVKILSLMADESSARVLGAMADSRDEKTLRRAAEITDSILRLR